MWNLPQDAKTPPASARAHAVVKGPNCLIHQLYEMKNRTILYALESPTCEKVSLHALHDKISA
jgi:hypothetical protein